VTPLARSSARLANLPGAIWVPGGPDPTIYRGTPVEMVQQMADEMGPTISTHQAIQTLVGALAEHRRIHIGLPSNVSPEVEAGVFIYALLDLGISKPVPSA
jgi:hypothetical protein